MKTLLLTLALLAVGGTAHLLAQERRQLGDGEPLDSIRRRIEFIDPRSGPPGTVVTLRTGGLPAVTPVRIGIGAVRFGFEETSQIMTDMQGNIELTVEVPSWAQNDRPHRFIVFDYYFAPIALSDAFHVTAPDGTVMREGTLTNPRGECPTLHEETGHSYTLIGDISGYEPGAHVIVEGTIVSSTSCGTETVVNVLRIRPAAPSELKLAVKREPEQSN